MILSIFREYVDRIQARPAYQKALERGGPYSMYRSAK